MATRNTATTKTAVEKPAEAVQPKKTQYRVKQRKLEPHSIVTVRNGFPGTLVYVSRHTGERFIWESFGSEVDMELQELRNAKGSNKAFFENGWFLIDDDEAIEYLGLQSIYKNAIRYDEIDELFDMSPEDMENRLKLIHSGQKMSIAHRAKQLIADGKIDSIKTITTLEKCLGVELIER